MKREIFFMPLGGGQRVGASCYYLRIGEANILLDAGVGWEDGVEFEPDFHALVTSPWVQSMNQIGQVFVSHAHLDHAGCLLKVMRQAQRAEVFMTEVTKMLAEYQLYDRLYMNGGAGDEYGRLEARSLLERVAVVSYMQTLDFGQYKATFFQAGHIPGAMMALFDTGQRRILYTGDYSLDSTLLTGGCLLPGGLQVDTVILCGLHAKHPGYAKRAEALFRTVQHVLRQAECGRQSVKCYVPQLSKGIEFLKALNEWNHSGVPIYLDRTVLDMVAKMERLSIPILAPCNKVMGADWPTGPHIYVTSNPRGGGYGFYQEVKVDFSLHEDFGEMKRFIKSLNPRQAVLVHCAREFSVFDPTVEQEMMHDSECRTQFLFAEEKELYQL